MKNLHIITVENCDDPSSKLLSDSAKERGINVHEITSDHFDFTKEYNFTKDDAFYRVETDRKSALVEKFLLKDDVITLYQDYRYCIARLDNGVGSSLIHEKYNLPIIKTVFAITKNRTLLKKYVDYLNGFPIIIKVMGGSHGVGVMKIDSYDSLTSIIDYLTSNNPENIIMRTFIDYKEHGRFIVLGNEVISSIEYKKVKEDFRSNVGEDISVQRKKFNPEIEKVAVQSVRTLGYEFGGVDILIDNDNKPHIAEVNFPCFFPRAQQISGIDISGKMIDFLIQKSNDKTQ